MPNLSPEQDAIIQEYIKSICRCLEANIGGISYGSLPKSYVYSRIAEAMMRASQYEILDAAVAVPDSTNSIAHIYPLIRNNPEEQ